MKDEYLDFIQELQEEIEDGVLTSSDIIQILREKGKIIDWYYDKKTMSDLILTEAEDFEDRLHFIDTVKEKREIKARYDADFEKLEEIQVSKAIEELTKGIKK